MNKQEICLFLFLVFFFSGLLSLYSQDFVLTSTTDYQWSQTTKRYLLNQTEYLLNLLIALNKNLETGTPESNEINELLKLYRQISENQRLIIENQQKIDDSSTQLTDDLKSTNEESKIENQKETELLKKLKTELKNSEKILKKYQRRRWIERIILICGIVGAFFLGKNLDMKILL